MSFIASSSTSREAWLKLGHLYANRSRSRIIYLKEKLSLTTRGTKPVTEFIQNLKSIADQLALAGAPLDEDHLIIHCLNGIGPELKEISAAVRAREQSISFETLHVKLVEFEDYLNRPYSIKAEPTTNCASISNNKTTNRMLDTGVSHHVTTDIQN
ncbi:hypothetical protein JRO89_XS09G0152700 [Xanthoceras sorbifolium]|uniref:Retrotransposon gag domain-containing protein n=1 Tax=Xanthoceras sorbifolium TaxID=99658 RepID=A0ABQ8HLM7_9ROSI|nr:hypothetical protein JRO89_XS09G0152700 [Xanthoceras sorbifolium]